MRYKDFDIWYWAATVMFLAAGIGGWTPAFILAMALTAVQIAHFAWRERSWGALAVQIRIAYLLFLTAAFPEPLRPLYWIPLAGTTVFIFTGYCFLARNLVLLPWNRAEPFTLDLVRRAFFSLATRPGIPLRAGSAGAAIEGAIEAVVRSPARSAPSCIQLLNVRLAQADQRETQGQVME